MTRAIGVAIMALLGALALYVGRALPGHQASTTSGAGAGQESHLTPPASLPTSTPAPPPVTSAPS